MTVTSTTFDDTALRRWWTEAYSQDRLVRGTFFQSWDWNRLWAAAFVAPDPRRELVLLKIEAGGSIVAAAPLFLQSRRAGPLTAWRYLLFLGERLAQYTDIVTTSEDHRGIWDAVLSWVDRTYPASWLFLHDVLPESTLSGCGLASRCEAGEPYLRLSLRGLDAEALAARCDAHMQRELRRARRLFDREGALSWEAVHAPPPELVARLIDLNRARFGEASWFAEKAHRDFFHDAAAAAGNECVFTVLRHDGDPAHIMASWMHGDSLLYVLSGMDERVKRYSPGTMNLDRSIRYAMERDCAWFDFLRGDEAYKREFAPQERRSEHCTLHTARSGLRFRAARAAQRFVQARQRRREEA